jgi:1-acyl-sn-glycerol-3-phosphate acyltransferase
MKRKVIMKIAVSIAVWVIGTLVTVAVYFAMLAAIALFPADRKRERAHAQCYWWADILTRFNPFWRLRVEGLENIDRGETYVIVANHQSLADIIILYKTKMQFKWVAKESLFRVPLVGWCLGLARHISLSRGDFASVRRVYKDAISWLRQGVSVLMFPEGTRSTTDSMSEFQSGAFKLAVKEKRPILPVVLAGTQEAIPRGSWLFKTRIDCSLKVLAPIATDGLRPSDMEGLMALVRKRFEDNIR